MKSFFFLNSSFWSCIFLFVLAFSACKKDSDSPNPASEKIPGFSNPSGSPVSDITASSARFSVTISGDGGAAITERGVVWNTSANPTISLSTKTSDGNGISSFVAILSGLAPSTKYYARAYATNANGTGYGTEYSFTTENATANLPVFDNPGSSPISGITSSFARVTVNISSDGGSAITARGVCWNTSQNPTIALTTKTSNGTGTGAFTANLSGLTAATTYYVRAYATNGNGTHYGTEYAFTTQNSGGNPDTITDVDGNNYPTVTIGTQVWMKENLKVSKYRNGEPIPTGLSSSDWGNTSAGAYAIWGNNPQNNTLYGKLYNWFTVADPRGLCPAGWHVPTDAEWTTLENFLGGYQIAGGRMKAVSSLWTAPNTGATNASGFSCLPGGVLYNTGIYNVLGSHGYWWSSTENPGNNAWSRSLYSGYGSSDRFNNGKQNGFSIRCIKD